MTCNVGPKSLGFKMRQALLAVLWTAILRPPHEAGATYRSIHISNADVCNQKTKITDEIVDKITASAPKPEEDKLDIGEGAIIFQLKNPPISLQKNIRNKRQVCEIQIEAPDSGNYGITARVEEMHMRTNSLIRAKDSSRCVDFVQYGRNDPIPFITFRKSKRLCGELGPGGGDSSSLSVESQDYMSYDDPGGNLLVWINLGGRRSTDHWPAINVVNLTLVVTAYRKNCQRRDLGKFRLCPGTERQCIRKDYFCDRHFNCPTKLGQAGDEIGCDYPEPDTTPRSKGGPGGEGSGSGSGEGVGGFGNLNLLSWTLICVCSGIALLLFVLVFCRSQKTRRGRKVCCCCLPLGPVSTQNSCEYSDSRGGGAHHHVRSVQELSRDRQQRSAADRGDTQNLYLPLTVMQASDNPNLVGAQTLPVRVGGALGSSSAGATSGDAGHVVGHALDVAADDEEAPPAYHDIFPEGVPQEYISFSQEAAPDTPGGEEGEEVALQPRSEQEVSGGPSQIEANTGSTSGGAVGVTSSADANKKSLSHNTSSQLLLNTQPEEEDEEP